MDTLIDFKNISKAFPGVQALQGVSFSIKQNSIHALVGENGAGKSTFINICGGIIQKDEGEIFWKGQKAVINNPHDSRKLGISVVHQHFPQCLNLTVTENIYMPDLSDTSFRILNRRLYNEKAQKLLDDFGFQLSPKTLLKDLPIAQRQIVEICKAIAQNVELIIMDEPTSALTLKELESFMNMVQWLKSNNLTIIYVSHKLDEVFQIADTITVFRDGQKIASIEKSEATPRQIATIMVGHEFDEIEPSVRGKASGNKEPLLEIKELSKGDKLKKISVKLLPGEIVGLAGLKGAGCSILMKIIFGMESFDEGAILLKGNPVELKNAYDGIEAGIAYLPSDRHREGLNLMMTVGENISLASFRHISKMGFVLKKDIENSSKIFVEQLKIKTSSVWEPVTKLSGGNQQKVVIGKWLATNPDVLLFDDPNRGVDVGAKMEIHRIVREIVDAGKTCLMTSSEVPELLSFCDRIITMYKGEITGIFASKDLTQKKIMEYVTGAVKTND